MADRPPGDGLPPRPDRPFVVETAAARQAGRSRLPLAGLALVVVLVAGLSAWGLSMGPAPDATATPAASPDEVARSSPTIPPVRTGTGFADLVATSEDEVIGALAVLGGWRSCPMWQSFGVGSSITAEMVETALAGIADPAGMHTVADALGRPQRVWVGGSSHDVARGFGGGAVGRVEGGDDSFWTGIAVGDGWAAVRIEPMVVPGLGLFAWQIRERVLPAPYCQVDSLGGPVAHVETVPDSADPLDRLFREAGWDVCRTWMRMEIASTPDPAEIDAVADLVMLGADDAGWVTVSVPGSIADRQVPVWLGDDPAVAGQQHGTRLVVVAGEGDVRTAWIAAELEGRPLAVAFDVVRTPGGRTAWLPTHDAAGVTGDCDLAALGGGAGTGGGDTGGGGDSGAGGGDPGQGAGTGQPGTGLAVEILRGAANRDLLVERFGWDGCRMTAIDAYQAPPDGAAIDAAAEAQGIEAGMLELDTPPGSAMTAWLGQDVVALANARQAAVAAVDGTGVAWLGDETRADEWLVLTTPAGRTAWAPTGSVTWPDACEVVPAGAGMEALPARSVTCWTDRDRCLEAIGAARRMAPDAFGPGVDVAAGLGGDCPPLERCAWDGPTQLVYVTAVPAPWASADQLRAFATGVRRFSRASTELPAGDISDAIRGLAARPALGLRVVPPDAATAACAPFGIDGRLEGSPWRPGAARVDGNDVQWPAGFVARFVPDVELVDPAGRVYRAGDRLQVSGTAGIGEGFVACAVTLVESARPLPSAP